MNDARTSLLFNNSVPCTFKRIGKEIIFRKIILLCILFFVVSAVNSAQAQTCPGGVGAGMTCLSTGTSLDLTAHGTCRKIKNCHASGKAIMISHSTSGEWSSFFNSPPAGVDAISCSGSGDISCGGGGGGGGGAAFFVLTSDYFNGDLGGLSGANALCLTDLTNNDWIDKSTAGTLTSARVKAFLCTTTSCNNLQPSTTYKYAKSGFPASGGTTFTTDSNGQGPGETTTTWESRFDVQGASYYTGRPAGTATLWPHTLPTTNTCGDWTTSDTEAFGVVGYSAELDSQRWFYTTQKCNTTQKLICIVNP